MSKGSTRKGKGIPAILPATDAIKRIYTLLERLPSGDSIYDRFCLFVEACNQCIDDLPHYFGQAVRKEPIKATEESMQRWRAAKLDKISRSTFEAFCEGFAVLLTAADTEFSLGTYPDLLGPIYMEIIGSGRWNNDEFYTPYPVASLMARMTLGDTVDIESEFYRRCREAIHKDELLQALTLACGVAVEMVDRAEEEDKEEVESVALETFVTRLWPAVRRSIEPLSICDPAVGSGVMLLAAAEVIPRWLINIGYAQFFGTDIRHLPVRMTELNLKLYGITPIRIKPADLLKAYELIQLPSPHKEVYQQLQTDKLLGNPEAEEKAVLKLQMAGQLNLFDGTVKPDQERRRRSK